ncbi:MAG: acetyl-CoA carboxylase carboxyltransferase subunit alpha [Candidatus Electryoneaceae bacterium]|nr:acetyl-CoA carboxylase carboxyltransferase subunit alpha [Candidatus Electryoneaceae bacterium]
MKRVILEFEKPIFELQDKINELEQLSRTAEISVDGENPLEEEIERLRKKASDLRTEIYSNLSRWQCVQLARHPRRPYTLDYIHHITDDFVVLCGDRCFGDDHSIISGLAHWGSHRVVVIGHQKGRGTKDNLYHNFGMPHPEGYRKALRMMRLAEKFGLPVVTLIDTPGAYPGLGAEERGQAAAIADNLFAMAQLGVPIVAVVIGEGGSGGALALGVADRVYMLQYAIYSVISPEGCASILWRDAAQAQIAADALRLTAKDLAGHELIDGIIEEPFGGAHNDYDVIISSVGKTVSDALDELITQDSEQRIEDRIAKFSRMGRWNEV